MIGKWAVTLHLCVLIVYCLIVDYYQIDTNTLNTLVNYTIGNVVANILITLLDKGGVK